MTDIPPKNLEQLASIGLKYLALNSQPVQCLAFLSQLKELNNGQIDPETLPILTARVLAELDAPPKKVYLRKTVEDGSPTHDALRKAGAALEKLPPAEEGETGKEELVLKADTSALPLRPIPPFHQKVSEAIAQYRPLLAGLVSAEELKAALFEAKTKEYQAKIKEVVQAIVGTKVEQFSLGMVSAYEGLKKRMVYNFQTFEPGVSYKNKDGEPVALDEVVYHFSAQKLMDKTVHLINKLPAMELATDNFQEEFERVISVIEQEYLPKGNFTAEETASAQRNLALLKGKLDQEINAVKSLLEKEENVLYGLVEEEKEAEAPDFKRIAEAYKLFAAFALNYKKVLGNTEESLNHKYALICKKYGSKPTAGGEGTMTHTRQF